MDREKLEKQLVDLKKEISNLGEYEETTASRLRMLIEDIEFSLEDSDEANKDILDSIQGNIDHFEEIHPTVTEVLNRIATLLSGMGI